MSLSIGIIGLPQSGKTTIFDGLTRGKSDSASQGKKGPSSHVGVTSVPEPRLDTLANMLLPKKVIYNEAKYVDVGATVKSLVDEKGIGGQLLNQLSAVDALIVVIRSFEDDSIPHVEGNLDVDRDITAMNMELIFSDLAIIERRLKKIETSLKGAKQAERTIILKEQALLTKLKVVLENNVPVRELELTKDELKAISNYQFLSAKPLLIAVNIGEAQLPEIKSIEKDLNSRFLQNNRQAIALCGKLETELSQLDSATAEEFRSEYNMDELKLDLAIQKSFELLGLICFFTTASDELRAWSIRKNSSALQAAGKIHTDMERGFIRAEVISFDELIKSGNLTEAKKHGLLRLEGKEYTVQDGDVITFLFNI